MERTPESVVAAIKQIRDYAGAYEGKRKDFYDNLYAMLATPIPRDDNYDVVVKKIYLAAIGALTSEIQPPSDDTYVKVVARLNSAIDVGTLGTVNIADYLDEGMEDGYQIAGAAQTQDLPAPRTEQLQKTLPRKRKLTKTHQALVDKFRAEIPSAVRPFAHKGQQRG